MASDNFFSDYYDPCATCGQAIPDGLVPEAAFPQATAAAAGPAPTSAGPGGATAQRGRVAPMHP